MSPAAGDGGTLLGGRAGVGRSRRANLLQSLRLAVLVDLVDDALDGRQVGLCGQGQRPATPRHRDHGARHGDGRGDGQRRRALGGLRGAVVVDRLAVAVG